MTIRLSPDIMKCTETKTKGSPMPHAPDYTKLTYLLVDDSPVMLSIVLRTLRGIGVDGTVHKADSGKKALAILESEEVDFIISDWNMPGMTGLDLLQHARAMERYKCAPFLMLTAEAQRRNVVAAGMCGASGYLTKPFQPEALKEHIESILADVAKDCSTRVARP